MIIKVKLHRILSSALESEKMMMPEKSSKASIRPKEKELSNKPRDTIVVSVPYSKSCFIGREYVFELC